MAQKCFINFFTADFFYVEILVKAHAFLLTNCIFSDEEVRKRNGTSRTFRSSCTSSPQVKESRHTDVSAYLSMVSRVPAVHKSPDWRAKHQEAAFESLMQG